MWEQKYRRSSTDQKDQSLYRLRPFRIVLISRKAHLQEALFDSPGRRLNSIQHIAEYLMLMENSVKDSIPCPAWPRSKPPSRCQYNRDHSHRKEPADHTSSRDRFLDILHNCKQFRIGRKSMKEYPPQEFLQQWLEKRSSWDRLSIEFLEIDPAESWRQEP